MGQLEVLDALRELGGRASTVRLAEDLPANWKAVYGCLERLQRRGLVRRVRPRKGRAVWEVVEASE